MSCLVGEGCHTIDNIISKSLGTELYDVVDGQMNTNMV